MYPQTLPPLMGGTVLKDVPAISFASGERFTPMGSLRAVAEFLGQEVTYPWLMGSSGAAFRACWSDDWSLEMTYAAPEDVVKIGAAALGLETENRLNERPEAVWEAVRDSLGDDMPVLSCGLAGAPEFCIIYGYAADPQTLHVRSYFQKEEGEVPFQPWMGWHYGGYGRFPLVVLRPGAEGRDVRGSLQRALRFARGEGTLAEGATTRGLHFGLTAYDRWVRALDELKGDLEGKAFNMALNLNAFLDARRTAGEYLQILAAMREAWRPALLRAAEHYRHQVSALADARRILYFPRDLPEEAASQATEALGDAKRRAAYARSLKGAKEEELLSLEWIEKALE